MELGKEAPVTIPKMTPSRMILVFAFLMAALPLILAPKAWAEGSFATQGGTSPCTTDCAGACNTASDCNPGFYCDNGSCYFHCDINSQHYNSCCKWNTQCTTQNYYCDTSDKKEIYDGQEIYKAGICRKNSAT